MALDMARTPNTLAPFQFMTFPPPSSILKSSSSLSGCTSKDNGVLILLMKWKKTNRIEGKGKLFENMTA